MTRLADPDALALPRDLYVGVCLASNHDVFLEQLDRVVLTIVDVLR